MSSSPKLKARVFGESQSVPDTTRAVMEAVPTPGTGWALVQAGQSPVWFAAASARMRPMAWSASADTCASPAGAMFASSRVHFPESPA